MGKKEEEKKDARRAKIPQKVNRKHTQGVCACGRRGFWGVRHVKEFLSLFCQNLLHMFVTQVDLLKQSTCSSISSLCGVGTQLLH